MSEVDPNNSHGRPLDYAPANPSQITRRAMAVAFGVIVGIVCVIAAGFLSFVTFEDRSIEGPRPPPPKTFYVVAGIFFVLAGGGLLAFILSATASPRRRWFLIGLSIGAAAMALIEGLCFANS
jgi:hypothetical protein